ncbi:MAG: sulfatase [Verrucomicrobiota bacterium]
MNRLAVVTFIALLACLASAQEKPNILLICIDDLRPELGCYGLDYIESPHIDSIAASGRHFTQHFVQAPTCGASRYTLLTGRYGSSSNSALFDKADDPLIRSTNLPRWFRDHGYTTVSVGKISHHPGGRGGPDWDDPEKPEMPEAWTRHLQPVGPWQHPRGIMHGLAHGEIRKNAKDMALFQAEPGDDSIYPDGLTIETALGELDRLSDGDSPFLLAVGIIRPHLPFGAPEIYLEPYRNATLPSIPHPQKPEGKTTWHGSGEFMKYQRWGRNPNDDEEFALEVRRHYAACVTYADALVGRLLTRLEESGEDDNTIIVVWGDHGWHLGEHAIWGKHALFEESLRSPLIIRAPGLPSSGGGSKRIVETLDIFPTLCDLAGVASPEGLPGASLVPLLNDPMAEWDRPAFAYRSQNQTVRTPQYRLIRHAKGSETTHVELYPVSDGVVSPKNVADDRPEVIPELIELIKSRL